MMRQVAAATIIMIMAGGSTLQATENDTLRTIFSRKSVRAFAETPLPVETLDLLVRAGMAAPTAVDKRPWEFVVITDRTLLQKMAEVLPYAAMAARAGGAIMVCGDIRKQHGGPDADFWIMDCSAASQNILLAAESLGLGAVWTAIYPDAGRVKAVRELLDIPEHIIPLNLIPLGVPAGEPQPKDKYNPQQIHWNRW